MFNPDWIKIVINELMVPCQPEMRLLRFKIEINREKCVACGTCYSLDPAHFEPGDDRKSRVVGGFSNGTSEGSFDDEKIEDSREAEESCPVSVIKVTVQA